MGDTPANTEDTPSLKDVLEALDDSDCRAILQETAEPMTANELIDVLDTPKSTLYRKLQLLSDASLVREQIKLHPEGGRITRYQRDFDDVSISMNGEDEFLVTIERPRRSVDERLANIWSKMGDEL